MHFNKYCSRVSQKIYFHVICPDVALLDSRLKMVNGKKRKYNVPGRMQSQKRSLRWFPGWPPSHWSPVWSSPTQQQKNTRFKEWLLKLSANTVEQFVSSMTYLKATQISSWVRQWTHRCVHLFLSLVEVFQGLRWAFGVVSTAAGGDALLFKVSCVIPVGVIFHPAAMQLYENKVHKTL